MLLTKFTKISHVISVCLLGVHCGKPLVAYSHVISEETAQYHYSAIVRMNCDYGHERAEGSYALRCLDNGRWNDTSLRCKRKWSSGVRYHLVKLNRLPMTSAHALLNGTETAFRQVHARKPKFAIYFEKVNISWGKTSVAAIIGLRRPEKKHSPGSRRKYTGGFRSWRPHSPSGDHLITMVNETVQISNQ